MKTCISFSEAQNIVLSVVSPMEVAVVPLQATLGSVLAAPVRAHVDVPAYNNSAMDGFAVSHLMTQAANDTNPIAFPIVGYQPAGSPRFGTLQPGKALRIATGAMVPIDATAVVPLENVDEHDGMIVVRSPIAESSHIRFRGEETMGGDIVINAGVVVGSGVAGYLATIGVTEVPIHRRPRVGIVSTGNELQTLGSELGPGQIYDSNSIALAAAMQIDGVTARVYAPVDDDREVLNKALSKIMSENDVVVVTGGVSVGEKDYVKDVMTQLEVEPLFWKVRQKPGKPIFVGVHQNTIFFGLPGNPASALINYYEYVRPALRKMMGHTCCRMPEVKALLSGRLAKQDKNTHFVRAKLKIDVPQLIVEPVGLQGSHCMRSFIDCNALIVIPEDVTTVDNGDDVVVHMLPQL